MNVFSNSNLHHKVFVHILIKLFKHFLHTMRLGKVIHWKCFIILIHIITLARPKAFILKCFFRNYLILLITSKLVLIIHISSMNKKMITPQLYIFICFIYYIISRCQNYIIFFIPLLRSLFNDRKRFLHSTYLNI